MQLHTLHPLKSTFMQQYTRACCASAQTGMSCGPGRLQEHPRLNSITLITGKDSVLMTCIAWQHHRLQRATGSAGAAAHEHSRRYHTSAHLSAAFPGTQSGRRPDSHWRFGAKPGSAMLLGRTTACSARQHMKSVAAPERCLPANIAGPAQPLSAAHTQAARNADLPLVTRRPAVRRRRRSA